MITYGAYLRKDVKIGQSAVIITLADTLIAITAGILIFPLVFQYGLEPDAGPGLLFVTMPIAFAEMEIGAIIGPVFFFMALIAALTSAISILEIFARWGEEKGMARHMSTMVGGIGVWTLGLATVFSSTYLKDVKLLDKNPFDFFDFLTGSILLPLGGFLVAVFVGWVLSRETLRDELLMTAGQFSLWRFVTRYIAPIAVAGILLLKLGVIGG
jgi:NSS family neurotransmitter:Na+ symporter